MNGKNTTPYRLGDHNLEFLRRINENAYKAGKIPFKELSLDNVLSAVYKFFELNNDSYLALLEIVGKMEAQRNGS